MKNRTRSITLGMLAALPAIACAQSSVTIAGIVDAGLRVDGGGSGRVSSLGSGMRDANRITFSGIEDLGGAWKAGFVLESGFATDTGVGLQTPPGAAPGSMTFGRLAAVSLGSDSTGYLSMGRQYVPLWAISAGPANDVFGAGWLGGITSLYSFTVRASNSVVYTYGYTAQTTLLPAPRKGLGVFLSYSLSESSSPAPSSAGEQIGANLSYGNGTWWVGYGYHQIKGSNPSINATAPVTDAPTLKQQTLGAHYQFSFARLHVGVNTGKNGLTGAGALDRVNWHVGANIPVAVNQYVRFIAGQADDRTAAGADWNTFQIGYGYDLSKRTALYAAIGQIDNSDNAATPLAGALGTYGRGSTPRSVIAGVRHLF